MTSARAEILARIGRAASTWVQVPAEPAPRRSPAVADPTALFAENVADYRAEVLRCPVEQVGERMAGALHGCGQVVVPAGFPPEYLPVDPHWITRADEALTARDLDTIDAVVTTATVGIALTGTIVLDHGPGQGRRLLSLVPDRHVCVIRADQIVAGLPEAMGWLDPMRALTWISGPSATSDIELERVEGVHGPRSLIVVIAD